MAECGQLTRIIFFSITRKEKIEECSNQCSGFFAMHMICPLLLPPAETPCCFVYLLFLSIGAVYHYISKSLEMFQVEVIHPYQFITISIS
jgi:hypothetical protein